eukprot:13229895-Ditylum_brightwellii.AAC.1
MEPKKNDLLPDNASGLVHIERQIHSFHTDFGAFTYSLLPPEMENATEFYMYIRSDTYIY